MKNIVSLSGGKDSTAMLIEMIRRGEEIHSVVFFDTGWEFPAMYDHLKQLENYLGIKIWTLHSRLPFDYLLINRPVIHMAGKCKGKINRYGYGWPSMRRRWCTTMKTSTLDYYAKPFKDAVQCIGFAADEADRLKDSHKKKRFPLLEYGITEAEALSICKKHGFHWNGLYNQFKRVSCYCCPLKNIRELRTLRKRFPFLWKRMLELENQMSCEINKQFKDDKTLHDFEKRFAFEDSQKPLFSAPPFHHIHPVGVC